jgi:hypothetical protein
MHSKKKKWFKKQQTMRIFLKGFMREVDEKIPKCSV